MTRYRLARRIIVSAVAVSLALAATSIGAGISSAAASPAGATATSAPAVVPGSQSAGKAAVHADGSGCVTPGTICAPGGKFTLSYTVTGSGNCSWTASITWGDGTTGTVNYGSAGFTAEHTYTSLGLFDLSVTGSGTSPDPGTTCTFVPFSAVIEVPMTCASTYQTVVTEHAGDDESLPELYTDAVTLTWCTDGNGHVQILSGSQAPSVQQAGFSFSGALIALLNAVGFSFGVTPATAPVPAITNQPPGYASASVTASGLSFNETFDVGQVIGTVLTGFATSKVAGAIGFLIRSGKLGAVGALLTRYWEQIVALYDAFAARHFGLPASVANWLASFPVGQIRDKLIGVGGQIVATILSKLAALGSNPTVKSIINAIQSTVQTITNALKLTVPVWRPQITTTIGSSLVPSVDNTGTKTARLIFIEDPTIVTTPAS